MTAVRVIGALLALVGLVLTVAPTLAHDPGPAADTFAAIERRIPWGGLAGAGALLMARRALRPWQATIAAAIFWVTLGLLVARLVGLALDGADSSRQWLWVAVETAIVLGAAAYLRRNVSTTHPAAPVGPPDDDDGPAG